MKEVEKKMAKKHLIVSVPSYFKCPISLDVMKSPVSLCTGVTYDRASIQTWLDGGHNTCPATMLPLPTKDFTPNHTLQSLIRTWQSQTLTSHPTLLSPRHALSLLLHLQQLGPTLNPISAVDSLSKMAEFIHHSPAHHRDLLLNAGCIPTLVAVFRNFIKNLEVAEAVVRVLLLVLNGEKIDRAAVDLIEESWLLAVLRNGSDAARIDAARVLELVFSGNRCDRSIAELEGVSSELLRLMCSETDEKAIDASLSALIAVASQRKARPQITRLGAVRILSKLLSVSDSAIAEKVLRMLEMLSACAEGRTAICEDPSCVAAIVGRMLKVPNSGTERAVVVLWSVCCRFQDRKAQEAVTKSNGLPKILLLMQSNCSPAARQMCVDLIKVCRVNSKSCLSSYDTKTTHIMPF